MAEVKKKQKIADKLLNGGGVFTFLRSIVSSQVGSWVDFGMSMLFYSLILVSLEPLHRSNLSVAIGAISGGVVNCYINYCFTFHAQQQSIKAIVVKYAMVWVGSLLLNMYGTTGLADLLTHWHRLSEWNISADVIFAAARLAVSLIVLVAWNYLLQRNFVYRPTRFDRYAIEAVDVLTAGRLKRSRYGGGE